MHHPPDASELMNPRARLNTAATEWAGCSAQAMLLAGTAEVMMPGVSSGFSTGSFSLPQGTRSIPMCTREESGLWRGLVLQSQHLSPALLCCSQ